MAFKLNSILLLDNIDKECGRLLEEANIATKTVAKLPKDELIAELKHHDGIIVRSATKLTTDVLEQCGHLKAIGRAGTGVDNIDVTAATKQGIIVMNTPGGNTLSAAEQTCALICCLSRSIPQACASLKLGHWDRKKYMGNELYGKTLAILGLGRIGREVSKRMKSFGMHIIGYDPIVPKETATEMGIAFYPLEEIWPQADYITVHTPLIPQTKNLIGEKSLAMCKPTVKIVNVARGGIVDEMALLKFLEAEKCGGAALDVFAQEPPTNTDLLQHPKVICTPHLGANTYEAQRRVAVEIAQQFIEMSLGQSFAGVVNLPELAQAGKGNSRQWLQLAEYLGSIIAQLRGETEKPFSIDILLHGEETKKLAGILKCAVLSGILSKLKLASHLNVNLINAMTVAATKGMSVTVSFGQPGAQHDGIEVKLSGDNKGHSVGGTLIDGKISLCELEGSIFDPKFILEQNAIFVKSHTTKLTDLMSSVAPSELICVVVSTDSLWFAIKTRKVATIKSLISARL